MQKALALLLALLIIFSAAGCSEEKSSDKRLLTVWVFSEDYKDYIDWTVNNYCKNNDWYADISVVSPEDMQNFFADSEGRNLPDVIMIQSEDIEKFANNGIITPLSEAGVSVDKSRYYDFAINAGTVNNKLYAMCWHASPGLFAYRRSIASAYLGTDEPDKISSLISDWKSFLEVSQLVKAASAEETYMLGGTDDITRSYFKGNFSNIEKESLNGYLELAYKLKSESYVYGADMWSQAWLEGFNDSKSIFGYFLSGIAFESVLCEVSDESYGDWAVIAPFSPYTWGGAYFGICSGSDNQTDAANFIELLTVDEPTMEAMTLYSGIFTANKNVNKAVSADSQFELKILNGQNLFDVLIESAENTDYSCVSAPNDSAVIALLNSCAQNYSTDEYELSSVVDSFYKTLNSFVG